MSRRGARRRPLDRIRCARGARISRATKTRAALAASAVGLTMSGRDFVRLGNVGVVGASSVPRPRMPSSTQGSPFAIARARRVDFLCDDRAAARYAHRSGLRAGTTAEGGAVPGTNKYSSARDGSLSSTDKLMRPGLRRDEVGAKLEPSHRRGAQNRFACARHSRSTHTARIAHAAQTRVPKNHHLGASTLRTTCNSLGKRPSRPSADTLANRRRTRQQRLRGTQRLRSHILEHGEFDTRRRVADEPSRPSATFRMRRRLGSSSPTNAPHQPKGRRQRHAPRTSSTSRRAGRHSEIKSPRA